MAAMRPRNDPVRLFGRRVMLLALVLVACLAGSAVWNAYQKERESASLRADAEREFADLSARERKLNRDIAQLGTDRGVEAALRQQYALAAKGEHLIVIVDPEHTEPLVATTSPMQEWLHKALPWW